MADDGTNLLDVLVRQVEDETLRARLAREIDLLRGSRRFGLVFDRHLPESVRLVDHPIRKGVRVGLRDESTDETWTVMGFTDTSRQVAILGEGLERPVEDLIVIREFGEPVYPGLKSVERIQNGPDDAPWHVVINGENFHALQALRSTHREKVDLIYIDPPYNTGNEGWIYNDRYVDKNDRAKSSKWLSFLERRLLIARDLLKPTGVVIVAIGEDEQHRLRMLLDQVLDDRNFIATVVWQGGVKNDARFLGGGIDYMLIYARDKELLKDSGPKWREPKGDFEALLSAGELIWKQAKGDHPTAVKLLAEWRAANKGVLAASVIEKARIDVDGSLYKATDLSSTSGANRRYDVLHPVTGRPVKVPKRGWGVTEEVMAQMIAEGRVVFGADHKSSARVKTPIENTEFEVAKPSFYKDRRTAAQRMEKVLGDKRFPFPKDHEVLMRWIRLVAPRDAVVLDFFGGSGTTTEAVMRLNAEDGGTRQSILVTNNEVGAEAAKKLRSAGHHPGDIEWESKGVFEYVCRPRLATVVTGKRADGSTFADGIPANVEMFGLTYLDPGRVRRGHEFAAVAPLMWLEGGARGERIDSIPKEGWALTGSYGVLFTIDALSPFADAMGKAAADERAPAVVFVITDSPTEYQQACERLPVGIETVRLYQDYLSNYTINVDGGVR